MLRVMPDGPHRVLWSDHAHSKAVILGAARRDIEEAVIEHHDDGSQTLAPPPGD